MSSRHVTEVRTERGVIRTRCIVNCAGGWAPAVGALAGVSVPLVVMKRAYAVTDTIAGVADYPVMRDYDMATFMVSQGDSLLYTGFETEPLFVDEVSTSSVLFCL